MVSHSETQDRSDQAIVIPAGGAGAPGLVLVFAAGRPASSMILRDGGSVELGRQHPVFEAHPTRACRGTTRA
ncbi:hypothetical protein [Sorangium sp. So ce1153]|uniref:hypothetical protein n=1 Tax=Sorangium sp. So ce1153 TaxID=3133333 RepID=UPI003F639BFC